jgi:hypothetical protein
MGPNYVLDKGFKATTGSAYAFGEILRLVTHDTVARATSAAQTGQLFVCQEDVDQVKVDTGNVVVGSRVLGVSRVLAGGTITVGAKVTNNTSARAVVATAGQNVLGVAWTAGASGEYIDVLLTPGALA